jgi:Predicted GTPase
MEKVDSIQLQLHLMLFPEMEQIAHQLSGWEDGQESRPLNVMIMGEAKSGKSTFVNSIFGKQLVSSDILPKTSVVTMFKYGLNKKMIIYFLDGRISTYENNQFADLSNEGIDKKIDWVEMYSPMECLRKLTIIDSPGLNSQYAYHTQNTERFFNRADIILWVADCQMVQTQVAYQYIKKIIANCLPVCMILNQLDNFDEEEEEESVEEWIKRQRQLLIDKYDLYDVIGISAALVLKGKIENNEELINSGRWYSAVDLFEKLIREASNLKRNGKWRYLIYLESIMLKRVKLITTNLHTEHAFLSLESIMQSGRVVQQKEEDIQHFLEQCRVNSREFSTFVLKHQSFLSMTGDKIQTQIWLERLGRKQPPVVTTKINDLKKLLTAQPKIFTKQKKNLLLNYQRIYDRFKKYKYSGIMRTYPFFKNHEFNDLYYQMIQFNKEVGQFQEDLEVENERQERFITQLTQAIRFINYNNQQIIEEKFKNFKLFYKAKKEDCLKKIDPGFFEKLNQLSDLSSEIIDFNQALWIQKLQSAGERGSLKELNKAFETFRLRQKFKPYQETYDSLVYDSPLGVQTSPLIYLESELSRIETLTQSNIYRIQSFNLSEVNDIGSNVNKARILLVAGIIFLIILVFR